MGDCTRPERQLRLVRDLTWLDRVAIRTMPDIVNDVLATNPAISETRRDAVVREVARRVALVAG